MSLSKNAAVLMATALSFLLLSGLNHALFSALEFDAGINWIYLPSGLQLGFILIFVELGAAGIVLASLLINFFFNFNTDALTALVASLLSGFAPWLARLICIDHLKLDVNLDHLDAATLLKVSALFAFLSGVLQQLWFSWRHDNGNFLGNTLVMSLGGLAGTLVMLYAAKLLIKLVPALSQLD
jgi:hypothetical protein